MHHLFFRPVGQAVKTPASHAGNTGSIPVRVTSFSFYNLIWLLCVCTAYTRYITGADDGEVPPVPIPNTEVKLTCADNTWGAAPWKDK